MRSTSFPAIDDPAPDPRSILQADALGVLSLLFMLAVLLGLVLPAHADGQDLEFFEKKIRPILAEHCVECHGPDEASGGLRLDYAGGIKTGGDQGSPIQADRPEESLLLRAVRYTDEDFQMPPKGKLSDSAIRDLEAWITSGAALPTEEESPSSPQQNTFDWEGRRSHWAYQPLLRSVPPTPSGFDRLESPVDAFLASRWVEKGLTPADRASAAVLCRRLSFDLIGLPPTPGEIEAFEGDDHDDACHRLVDRLLASPHYAERWARHWLDLVRYAESLGHEFDYELFNAWRYRDYVIRAMNNDLPYDRFMFEHVAGDVIDPPRRDVVDGRNESVIAPAFFLFGEATHSPVDVRLNQCDRIDNQIDVLTKAFLGQSVSCARCHDHKFDAITSKDYYALAGFLKSSRYAQVEVNAPESLQIPARNILEARQGADDLLADSLAGIANQEIGRAVREWREMVARPGSKIGAEDWKKRLNDPRVDVSHPLYLVKYLASDASPQAIESLQREWARLSEADLPSSHRIVGSAHTALSNGWSLEGTAFASLPQADKALRFVTTDAGELREFTRPDAIDSSLISRKLEGCLRGPTFTIEDDYLHVRAAGLRSRVNIYVDGFAVIRDPIYGGLTFPLQSAQPSWRTVDMRKWKGHRAYVEFADVTIPGLSESPSREYLDQKPVDGYFQMMSVVSSSSAQPPTPVPSAWNRRLLEMSRGNSSALMAQFEAESACAIEAWKKREGTPAFEEGRELLAALMESGIISPDRWREGLAPEKKEKWAALHSAIDQWEHGIQAPQRVPTFVEGTGEDEFVFIRGNYKTTAGLAPRRFLEVFDGGEPLSTAASGRLQLAARMTDPENPLVPRVYVNRLWKHHFGEGLVRSTDDFGRMGQPPLLPELLDWLSAELREGGGSSKHMHRLLVTSHAYQLSASVPEATHQVDPRNDYFSYRPSRRLEAEGVRDALLAVSGRLSTRVEGQSVLPHLTEFMSVIGRPEPGGPMDGDGLRTLYISVRRNFMPVLMSAFDYPPPQTTMGRRGVSNVPAQALTMLNDPFVTQCAKWWAERLLADKTLSPSDRLDRAFLTAFGRRPTEDEHASAQDYLAKQDGGDELQAWTSLCHALFNAKEFIFVR